MVCRKENVDEKVPLIYGHSNPCSLWEDNVKSKTKKASNFPRKNLAAFEKSRNTKSQQVKHVHRPVGGSRVGCEKGSVEEEFATVSYEEMCRTIDQQIENHEKAAAQQLRVRKAAENLKLDDR